MGWHSGSGDKKNTVKTRKNGGVYFHLKEWPRQGPTKLTQAIPAEGSHREAGLRQTLLLMVPQWRSMASLLSHVMGQTATLAGWTEAMGAPCFQMSFAHIPVEVAMV